MKLEKKATRKTIKASLIMIAIAIGLGACASTSSTVIPIAVSGSSNIAIVPFSGLYGPQATELISQHLAAEGVAIAESSKTREVIGLDTDLSDGTPASIVAMSSLGEELGVDYLFVGTITAESGPLYSFDHVNMTMRLIDLESKQTRWIGRYGNSFWTSAISTQGDIQRGSKHIVKEFINAGGPSLIE